MKRLILTAISIFTLFCASVTYAQTPDYGKLAKEITYGTRYKYDQAQAIYMWIADNISYDTSFRIYDAANCLKSRKGVCQAYCELFKELAKPIGLKCTMVTGISKDVGHSKSRHNTESHAWLIVEDDNGREFFIDPTWGAGSVQNGIFVKNENDLSWFDVSPAWMIFTHYPSQDSHQLMNRRVNKNQFLNMPCLRPSLQAIGLDGEYLLPLFLSGEVNDMPLFYDVTGLSMNIIEMPMSSTIEMGTPYTFRVSGSDRKLAIIENGTFYHDWTINGNVMEMTVIPRTAGTLKLAANIPGKTSYEGVVSYDITEPSAERMRELMSTNPALDPRIRQYQGYSQHIEKIGFDMAKVQAEINKGTFTKYPKLYNYDDFGFTIIDAPVNGVLKQGETYQFVVSVPDGKDLALFFNGSAIKNWKQEGQYWKMVYTPKTQGALRISVFKLPEFSYFAMVEYNVE